MDRGGAPLSLSPGPLVVVRDLIFSRRDPSGTLAARVSVPVLDVQAGECIVLDGPSGSGKSTLLGVLGGVLPGWGGEARGTVLVEGRPVADLRPEERPGLVGFFPQEPGSCFLQSTVADVCAFVPENLGWNPGRIARARTDALDRLGILGLEGASPGNLSGGEQALVVLAALWMVRPRLILLDEALAALDPDHEARCVRALTELKAAGCALILAEHRSEAVVPLVDRWFRVVEGAWEAVEGFSDPPRELEAPLRPSPSIGGPPVVRTENLSFGRGRTLGVGLSLEVRPGEILALRGPNGVGKSTLLWTLAGVLPPQTGRVVRDGRVRLVGQNPGDQVCRPSVREELEVDLNARRRRGRATAAGEVEATLARAGLAVDGERSPFLLSEGGRRRLAVACGVLSGAEVLLLDEPTAGLDPTSARVVAELIAEFADRGGAVVCATHDEALVRVLGARVWDLVAPEPPPKQPEPPLPARPSRRDPRTGLVAFGAALAVALQPFPPMMVGLAGALVVLSYLPRGRWRALGRFCRALALFWVVPGVLLFFFVGPWEAFNGLLRLGLLTLLFHRFASAVDGKRLAVALTGWGVPYSAGFAWLAAGALGPPMVHRLGTIRDLLALRLTGVHRRSIPSPRVVAAMMVPVLVHLWQRANQIGMHLELQGFRGQAPSAAPRWPVGDRWVAVVAGLLGVAGVLGVHLLR